MIYLDNAATSFPKPESVYQAMDQFARKSLANPGRSGHSMALASEHALTDARFRLSRLIHAGDPDRLIFTLNGTDSLNIAIKGVLDDGDHVITTNLEHNSVSRPLVALAEAGRIQLTRVEADAGGTVDPDAIKKAITARTRLIAITHASNVLGTIQPITEISRIARSYDRILMLVDAAQTIGVVPIDVQAMQIDLLAFPGHKCLFGPTGTGGLYVGPRARPRPWREGGTGGDSLTPTQPKDYPFYLEGGTPNVLGIVGLAAGVEYVEQQTPESIRKHDVHLCDLFRERLEGDGIEFFGHRDSSRRVGTLSFRTQALPAPELAALLDMQFEMATRPGLHCSPYIHKSLGTAPDGLLRISPGPFTTADEIIRAAEAVRAITQGM